MSRAQHRNFLIGLTSAIFLTATPGLAQVGQEDGDSDEEYTEDIIVIGDSGRGAVVGQPAVEVELSEEDIASYGASNIQDLISQIAPLTSSSRGRGGGAPVLLLNGKRIADRREIFHIPPEAIEKVQVLPEEVALRYGYAADQRVINFILKSDFTALTTEAEYGQSWHGDPHTVELEADYLSLTKSGRWSLNSEYTHSSRVLESDRDIIGDDGTTNAGHYRTLVPESDALTVGGLYSTSLGDTLGLTLNAQHERTDSRALRGRDMATGLVQQRDGKSRTTHLAATMDGAVSGWQWTWTANADWVRSASLSFERGGAVNEETSSLQRTFDSDLNVSGALVSLPAGDAMLSLRAGLSDIDLDSDRDRAGATTSQSLSRTDSNGRANLEIPLLRNAEGALGALGQLSLNANGGAQHLSDFGTLYSYGYGLMWKPSRALTINASVAHEKAAPPIQQLGAPLTVTENVAVYDLSRGETVLVEIASGGNSMLGPEKRSDFKLGISWEPPFVEGLTLLADYYDNSSRGQIADLPLLTPEVEAAFTDRVTRDANGKLVALDQRSINFSRSGNRVLRYGFDFQKRFGASESAGGGRGGGRQSGRRGRFGDGGRWNVDVFHSIRLEDEVLVRPGLKLDLLDGDALGSSNGAIRHLVEMEGGWAYKGIGLRASAKYESGSRVDGGDTGSDLQFGDLFTVDLRTFVDFDNNPQLLAVYPWLKGMRLRLKVENLFDTVREVRDGNGLVPLSYQSGYVDPRGRMLELSVRKQF